MRITGPDLHQGARCEHILRALPDWFGIEEAICQYSRDIDALPTLLAWKHDQLAGFLTLKIHTPYAAEIYVAGVAPEYHRIGIGTQLMSTAVSYLRSKDIEYLQVKTLGPSRPDPSYARTRAFYEKMGFRPLEEFTQIWNAENPCLIMVKRI